MHQQSDTRPRADFNNSSWSLLRLLGAAVAALGLMSVFTMQFAKAQDMSNGADNFYTSDKVTVQTSG
jgi:hypothetical protein